MIRTRLLALAALTPFAAPVVHAAETWQLDKPHAQVLFTVSHLGFTELTGQFRTFDADLAFDPSDWSKSTISARIDAASIDMNHEGLNKHLRNPDFFDVENHPTLDYRSTSVEVLGEGRLRMHGELTMIGKTLPVSLDVTVNNIGKHPMRGTPWAGFRAEGRLKRSDWGMSYAAPAVGDDIAILINLEAAGPTPAE